MTNAENSEITASNPGEDRAARKKQYEALLNASRDMLTLFSGDERLTYLIDEESERFLLRPREKKVLIPLSFFESQPFSENRFLFHLYTVLALYPDFERCPEDYLNRPETFRPEAEELTGVFLDRVRAAGLSGDRAYQPDNVFFYMQNEILSFLEDCDTWASMLCVLQRAPVYQDPAVKADIARMLLLEDVFPAEDDPTGVHRDLAPCLLIREFWGMEEIENPRIRQILAEPVFGTDRFSFLRDQLTLCALRNTPCADRDRMIRSFLLPSFLQLFREDIDRMAFSSTVSLQEQEQKREARRKKSAAQSAENFKEMLRELDSEKKHREAAVGELLHGTRDLSSYGVTDADRALFAHYEAAVRPAREQMKAYWRMLIGDTSREVSVRIPNMPKGRLSVETLIRSWPALTEAERRQNYRDLAIFDDSELRRQTQVLPRYLDICFAIDSSGSMRGEKLGPAREALAIVLLSLEDFAGFLQANAQTVHEPCEVRTQVRLFGTGSRETLSFSDRGLRRQANRILSVSRLDGSLGSTDDGACLEEFVRALTPQTLRELQTGRRIRMVFEVTDGASSFPGRARKAVEELVRSKVIVQAIEIGSPDDAAARASFDYVFGSRGIFLGNRTRELPDRLMKAVRDSVSGVLRDYFRRGRA